MLLYVTWQPNFSYFLYIFKIVALHTNIRRKLFLHVITRVSQMIYNKIPNSLEGLLAITCFILTNTNQDQAFWK